MKNSASSAAAAPARILLVDDNKMGLAARKVVLEELGYQITTATEGQDALARFTGGGFDLIITDYKMPKMDGLQLIQKVRGLDATVPIIMLSGYADALGLTEASTGADSVIAKSATEITHLVRAVGRLLKRSTPKKPARSQTARLKVKRQSV